MPSNRGAHPGDEELFARPRIPVLRRAVRDLSWLRSRGYGDTAAKEIVGNRYRLKCRQRNAVARSSCTDDERARRLAARLEPKAVSGEWLEIDGFNVLITTEAALGGAYLFVGRDSAFRDVNPVQGTYRIVQQTRRAIEILAMTCASLEINGATWHLDRSVSNVGRVKAHLAEGASGESVQWHIDIQEDVDRVLIDARHPVVTSDSSILNASEQWLHLEALGQARYVPDANLVDLRPDGERSSPIGRSLD